jgi:anti-sigma factor RsiW
MNDATGCRCPRTEEISALMDGMLPGPAGDEVRTHAAQCPLCGRTLAEFTMLSTRLQALREVRCDVDLAAIVGARLPRPAVPRRKPRRSWSALWDFAPGGLAGAAALGAGAYLGLLLVTGSGAALRPAAMAVFDGAPPGALCKGLTVCSPRGR